MENIVITAEEIKVLAEKFVVEHGGEDLTLKDVFEYGFRCGVSVLGERIQAQNKKFLEDFRNEIEKNRQGGTE